MCKLGLMQEVTSSVTGAASIFTIHRTAYLYKAAEFEPQLNRQRFKQLTVRTVVKKAYTDCTKSL